MESAELREGAGERVLEEGWRRGVGDERTRGGVTMVRDVRVVVQCVLTGRTTGGTTGGEGEGGGRWRM